MKEKFENISGYYEKGNVLGMLILAINLYINKDILVFSFKSIELIIAYEIILSFMIAGILYSLHKLVFKLTLNPIKFILLYIYDNVLVLFFAFAYFFIFCYYFIRYSTECIFINTKKEKASE